MATNAFKVKNSINLQPGSAPSNPIRGDIYCSSADGKFYRYDDSVPGWVELGSGGGAGATVTVSQTGHGFSIDGSYIGKPIRNSGVANTYILAKADTAENAEVVGIITAVPDANSFSYSTGGEITGLTGLTPNTVLFLSGDTAGSTTITAPTTVGYIEKPLLIATASTKAIFVNMRGTTVGGTNLYTTIPLNGSVSVQTVTSLQTINVAAGEGGFIEGVIKIDATTDYVTTFKVEFARPITGTAYTRTPTYGCDALPTGSSIDITSGGVIQLTLPAISGFSSGSARFSMQAAAIGATLPLQIDASLVSGAGTPIYSAGAWTFKNDSAVTTFTVSSAGSATVGPASGSAVHVFQGGATANTIQVKATAGGTPGITWHDGTAERATINADVTNAFYFKTATSGTLLGTVSQGGAWTLGPSSGGVNTDHLFYNTNTDAGNSVAQFIKGTNSTATSNLLVRFFINNGGSSSGAIAANGSAAAAFVSYSDYRLKENIAPLSHELSNILALKPCSFDFKAGGNNIGFIAQEMREVYPDVVGEDSAGMLSIAGWDKTTARLVKAIQEISAQVEELKAEVAALKGQ